MKRSTWLTSFFLFISIYPKAQEMSIDSLLKETAFYADVMVNADYSDHRQRAHDLLVQNMLILQKTPQSYHISLDSIPWISVLKGPDFRIVTWQHRLSDEEYKYGGFIQWEDAWVDLKDTRPWVNGSLRNTYSSGAWYGALYYKLIPFQNSGKEYYMLFGFNAENSMVNTKVADVLDVSGKEVKFGLPVFTGREDPQTRIILSYADASSVQLFYDPELNAIIHDHLENLPGVGPSGESLAVSDGSQEGWIFKKGLWVYEAEMYDVKSEEPPMTDDRKVRVEDKDLFGRPKKP